jgi:CRISPR-associated protein Csc3
MLDLSSLVDLYRAFYRADKTYQPSARKCIQPIYEGLEIICRADVALNSPELLTNAIAGRLSKLMYQIHCGNGALGRWVIANPEEERQAILKFATALVDIYVVNFNQDVGRLGGKQRGYIEDTCEYLYRLKQDKENKESGQKEKV